jgi:hypothetical protein
MTTPATETDQASGCAVQRNPTPSSRLISYVLVLAVALIRRRSWNAA